MLTGACRRLKFYAMLTLEKLIVDTHSDFSPWSAVSVGFTDDRNFVIELEYRGYDPTELYAWADDHASDYDLLAIVSFDDAFKIARRLGVRLTELPEAIYDRFGEDYDDPESTSPHVESVYYDILGFINGCGVRYRTEKRLVRD